MIIAEISRFMDIVLFSIVTFKTMTFRKVV